MIRLLDREDICLIPACPEQLGGLPTPRVASERCGDKVINGEGVDVTRQYRMGAEYALKLCELYNCKEAILKEKSPSCGTGRIYDGSFTRKLTTGDGVTAELLKKVGILVYGESEISALFDPPV